MNEIKIGEYVRINNDFRLIALGIGKVIRINQDTIYVKMNFELPIAFKIDNIANHSKNIIDLIEVGDILEIKEGNDICYLGLEKDTTTVNYSDIKESIKNRECELLSILTKEQYNQNCYRLEN